MTTPDMVPQLQSLRDDLVARWLAALAESGESRQGTETPLEFHRGGLTSLLTLFLAHLRDGGSPLVEYLRPQVMRGFLAEYSVNRLVEIFQTLARLLVAEIRAREGDASATIDAVRETTDAVVLACCRSYEDRVTPLGGRFEELFEKSTLVSFYLDTHGRIRRTNEAAAEVLGVDGAELTGKNLAEFVVPEGLPVFTRMLGFALRGHPQIFDLALRVGDRAPTYLAATLGPVVAEGTTAGLRLVGRDVTEERLLQERLSRSEEKYRKLIENANDAILLFSLEDGRIADANFQALDLTGYRRPELAEMHLPHLFADADRRRAIELIQETIADGSSKFDGITLRRKDGREIVVEISSNVIEYGETKVIQSIFRDMTRRRQLEVKLQDRTRELERMQRRIDEVERDLLRVETALLVETTIGPFLDESSGRLGRLGSQVAAVRADLAGVRAAIGARPDDDGRVPAQLELAERNLERVETDLAGLRRHARAAVDRDGGETAPVPLNEVAERITDLVGFRARGRVVFRRELGDLGALRVDRALAEKTTYLAVRAFLALAGDRGRLAVSTRVVEGRAVLRVGGNVPEFRQDEMRWILDPRVPEGAARGGPTRDLKWCRVLLSWAGGAMTLAAEAGAGYVCDLVFPEGRSEVPGDALRAEARYDLVVVDKERT